MKHIYKFKKRDQIIPARKYTKRKRYLFFVMLVTFLIMSACMEDDFEGELIDVCPKVENHMPEALDERVPLNSNITVIFNKEMKAESINENTFLVSDANGPIAGTISYANKTASFEPTVFFPELADITVEITTEVYDLYDFTIEEKYQWTFSTGNIEDILAPYVVQTIPGDGEQDVLITTIVASIFNEPLNSETIGSESLSLFNVDNGLTVDGTVSYSDMVITFTPDHDLDYETNYKAVILGGVIEDMNGNIMEDDEVWEFKTKKQIIDHYPLPIDLGQISEYAILAGSFIQNLGLSTTVEGEVGLFPGTIANINPLDSIIILPPYGPDPNATDPGPVGGLPYDLILDKLILKQAYNNAKDADEPQPIVLSGDQGGNTLAPGIYNINRLKVLNGDLILDAGADPDAFWIFQVNYLLETGGNIILEGGADPNRVFWQVGVGETLPPNVLIGENTHFIGTILSKQGISVKSGATVTGRLMVKDGGVRLENATIALP